MTALMDQITEARNRIIERELERSRADMLARRQREQAENNHQTAYFARLGITGDIVRRPELERPSLELSVLTEAVYLSHYRNITGAEVVEVVEAHGAAASTILHRDGEDDEEWGDTILDAVGRAAGL